MASATKAKRSKLAGGPAPKDCILDAACELFATRGFSATTTRLIAQQAGVNSALLYYYFDDKTALYRALVERHASRVLATLERALATDGGPGERIDRAIDALFVELSQSARLLRILSRELSAERPSEHARGAHACLRGLFEAGEALLLHAASQGEVRIVDGPLLLMHVYGATTFFVTAQSGLRGIVGAEPVTSEEALMRARAEMKAMVRARLSP